MKVIKLGTTCVEQATGLAGTVTHWTCNMGKTISYLFQPRGLDDEGIPVKRHYLCKERLNVTDKDFEDVEVPFEILGSQVEDKASGYNGMAIEFVRHINGCFHVVIQPAGILPKTNSPVEARDFDLRGCSGEKIPQLNEEELRESKETRPSPTGDTTPRHFPFSEESFPARR